LKIIQIDFGSHCADSLVAWRKPTPHTNDGVLRVSYQQGRKDYLEDPERTERGCLTTDTNQGEGTSCLLSKEENQYIIIKLLQRDLVFDLSLLISIYLLVPTIPGSALFIQSHWGCLGVRAGANGSITILYFYILCCCELKGGNYGHGASQIQASIYCVFFIYGKQIGTRLYLLKSVSANTYVSFQFIV